MVVVGSRWRHNGLGMGGVGDFFVVVGLWVFSLLIVLGLVYVDY
jgi:hypothetical protein